MWFREGFLPKPHCLSDFEFQHTLWPRSAIADLLTSLAACLLSIHCYVPIPSHWLHYLLSPDLMLSCLLGLPCHVHLTCQKATDTPLVGGVSFFRSKPQLLWPSPQLSRYESPFWRRKADLVSMIHSLINDKSRNEDFLQDLTQISLWKWLNSQNALYLPLLGRKQFLSHLSIYMYIYMYVHIWIYICAYIYIYI